jgi:hypothetical protein
MKHTQEYAFIVFSLQGVFDNEQREERDEDVDDRKFTCCCFDGRVILV